jgi:hypothetical protein
MMSVFLEQILVHVSCLYRVCIVSVLYLYLECILSVLYLNSAPVSAPPPAVSAPVSAPVLCDFIAVCAVASQLHRRRIAVASPHRIAASHRRRIASLHEMQGTSLNLYSPVVQPTRCSGLKTWILSSGFWAKRRRGHMSKSWSKGCDSMLQQKL